ncbi:MAG: PD-(D/E)XK nuclease family protein [Chlamydiales bacterium]|nr:PD-(D/E)XK nuclease family protein [Chlamydiales bacterium]
MLTNDFSWSFSRANLYSECQKRYWYTYYGSWEGWPKTPWDKRKQIDPLASYLYALKQMQNMATYVGSTAHEAIEHFLKTKAPFTLEALVDHGKKAFLEGIEEAKTEKWKISPKKHSNLFEYYYNEPPTALQLEEGQNKVTLCLENWYNSPVVQKLAYHPDTRWLSIEELAFFQLAGKYKIVVVVDFALMWKDLAILFDWKTGEESDKTQEQLYLYALFANRVWNIPFDKIILSPFYLSKNKYIKFGATTPEPLELTKIEALEKEIEASCDKLSVLHAVQDPKEFAYTTERTRCNRCPFKELCQGVNYQECSRDELKLQIAGAVV